MIYIRVFMVVLLWATSEVVTSFINKLRPRQNDHHFPDDIFKHIFLNENAWILIKISLKYVPKGPINNITASFQITAIFLNLVPDLFQVMCYLNHCDQITPLGVS